MNLPPIEKRRQKEFESELLERARAWIPQWALTDDEPDFGRALLKIAARFSSEVAERLDRGSEKLQRGFLDWLAVRGDAARPARMPVVLKLADTATDPVLAVVPVRMQADTEGTPVVFETETDVCLLPGQLQTVVAVDGGKDEFYLPPPGLSDLKPLEPLPTQWRLKSFAAAGANKLQLDPDTGLVQDMIIEAAEKQYKITAAEKDIVTVEPPLEEGLPEGQVVNKVTSFLPFDGAAHNWQEHALYLGDKNLLNIEAEAKIEIVGAKGIGNDVAWQYWAGDDQGWQPLQLDQKSDGVVLQKPKGAIETNKINEISSRWIRAYKKTATGEPFRTDSKLGLRINSSDCGKKLTCDDTANTPSPTAEAMANTTPLVLDQTFYPLGRVPKQFDAFYLGSQEAFSKQNAEVQLCFQLADLSFAALSTLTIDQPAPGTSIIAGVGRDRFLHLLQFSPTTRALTKFDNREPLQPPSPALFGAAATTPNPVALDSLPPWRLPMWTEPSFLGIELFVGMTAGSDVWLWCEFLSVPTLSGWISLGQLPATAATGTPAAVDGLVYLDGAAPQLAALRDGKLFVRDWPAGTQWQPVDPVDAGNNPVTLKSIVPVLVDNGLGQLVTSATAGMAGVSDANDLYSVDTAGSCVLLAHRFSWDSRPAAFQDSSGLTVVGVDSSDPLNSTLIASPAAPGPGSIPSGATLTGAIEATRSASGDLHFLASAKGSGSSYLVDWAPFVAHTPPPMESEIPPEVGQVGGAPSALPHDVIIPGANADLLLAAFDVSQQKVESAEVDTGIVVPDSTPALAVNDVIAREGSTPPESHFVNGPGLTQAGESFYPIDSDFSTTTGRLWAYPQTPPPLSGTFTAPARLTLNSSDLETARYDWLLLDDGNLYQVSNITTTVNKRNATLSPIPPAPLSGDYIRPITTGGRVAPFMHLDPTDSGNWDASVLQRVKLVFPGSQRPPEQSGKAFSVLGNNPVVVVLGQQFVPSLGGTTVTFIVNAAAGTWTRLLGDTSANPELSWEYWNGKGWWKLPITSDGTFNLKSSGALDFQVPGDIAATDWSGKTDFWIRARLIGGDYGQEKVTVTTTTNGSVSQQTIDRSSEGIRAPQVVKLHIFYRICEPSTPAYVLTQDSGSFRDQSDANSTSGAIVEAFVPLSVLLGRLSGPAAQTKTAEECPPECSCRSESTAASAAPAAAAPADNLSVVPDNGRSLFIGFDKPLSQQPVNVLFLVDQERDHGQFAPMKVQALIGDRFVPIVANDTTRALGESGLLSMSFSVGPTPRELFGQSLFWLRLTPVGSDLSDWKPTLRGAYLNAVWASATETMTRELVGSSEGAPNLTLTLARPPLLDHILELRVKEPLGEEARTALLKQDKNSVLSSVEGLPGDWVLWKQVTDPGDEAANARVYALDESNGEIQFGDGLHGAIPPIGTDSIVAFKYKRTEPGASGSTNVPANTITARTQLGLVSPVPTVEAAFAADQAAGGAPPEPPERVVRFGSARLRHRGRAVTASDLEDLALQSSPKIAQVRCIVRPSYVKLVVVMRGNNPAPNAAEVRELRRLLLAAAPAALGATRALRIQGPDVRTLRVGFNLTIADLDYSGEVARDAKQRVKDLFDVATGGVANNGWQLGESPNPSDIAYVLSDVPRLEGIEDVELVEIGDDQKERAWPNSLKPTELAVLSEDPVRLDFTVAEVVA